MPLVKDDVPQTHVRAELSPSSAASSPQSYYIISNPSSMEALPGQLLKPAMPAMTRSKSETDETFSEHVKLRQRLDTLSDKSRRNSAIDGIHAVLSPSHISPAQLYSTDSGRLFHAGKICIVLVGLPARGKTHHAVSLTRYLRWLGVKTHAFHLGDYRRKLSPSNYKVPDDYFLVNASKETISFRQRVLDACFSDMFKFFDHDMGQVGIYDAVNATAKERRSIVAKFEQHNIQTLFVECLCTDEKIVMRNVRDVKIGPDYKNVDFEQAVRHYLRRIEMRIPDYEPMNEPELSYVKLINVAERVVINRAQFGYLHNRIIFFLMNSQIKVGSIFFARAGLSKDSENDYKSDASLSEKGEYYAGKLRETLFKHLDERKERIHAKLRAESIDKKLLSRVQYDHESPRRGQQHVIPLHSTTSNPAPKPLTPLGALNAGDITPPVTSGSSTPISPADARAVSTIRADDINETDKTSLIVWSSTRRRTVETANYFAEEKIHTRQRTQLNQLNPGEAGDLTDDELREKYPIEYANHQRDPYHHRYPRSESYHDVAVRMEPLILELERVSGDVLIIAHETVLQVLYGYYMALSVAEIPKLSFPCNEIVEIIPNAYVNQSNRIPIPGVDP